MCPVYRREWLPYSNGARRDVIRGTERALDGLERSGGLVRDESARKEVKSVERGLRGVREGLYGNRWI